MDNLVKLLSSVQSYFNDFVGSVAPGAILLVGLIVGLDIDVTKLPAAWSQLGSNAEVLLIVTLVAILYALGHFLLVLASPIRTYFAGLVRKTAASPLKEYRGFKQLSKTINQQLKLEDQEAFSFSTARNIAMTLSADGEELGRRFKFISLFCFGSGMAVLVSAVAWMLHDMLTLTADRYTLLALAVGLTIFVGLSYRGAQFEESSQKIPFDTALADILANKLGLKTTTIKTQSSATVPTTGTVQATAAPDVFPAD